MVFVPVFDVDGKTPLMPTKPSRARRWVKERKATFFWKNGVYCVRLNVEPSGKEKQEIVVGIDPGSKKEGFTVKSEAHTFLNIQADAVTWVKDAIESRRNARRARRLRNTPCRKNKTNRAKGGLVPSTRARWGWKLRIINWLRSMFPVTDYIVENIAAWTKKGKRRWNVSFSPLEVGKEWFYSEIRKLGTLWVKEGFETKELRDNAGLKKNKDKMSNSFDAHCVDSWVLANSIVGGHIVPDNTRMLLLAPLRFFRRQLHVFNYATGAIRKRYGGSLSLGIKRGSLISHPKYGLSLVGGESLLNDRLSLHDKITGKRLSQSIKKQDCKILTNNKWRAHLLPIAEARGIRCGRD